MLLLSLHLKLLIVCSIRFIRKLFLGSKNLLESEYFDIQLFDIQLYYHVMLEPKNILSLMFCTFPR